MGLHLQGMGKFQERTDGQGRGKSSTIKPKNVQTLTESLVHLILSVSQKLDLMSVLLRKLLYSGVETTHKLMQLIVFLPCVSLSLVSSLSPPSLGLEMRTGYLLGVGCMVVIESRHPRWQLEKRKYSLTIGLGG